jgi:hypothetical protein
MHLNRLLAALIAGAVGAVAGGAATMLVALFTYRTVAFFTGSPPRRLTLFVAVFVGVFMPVMVAVFQALERLDLVREPPSSQSPLGLSARSSEPSNGRGTDDEPRQRL